MYPIYAVVNYALGALVLFLVSWRILQFIVAFTSKEIRSMASGRVPK